jgi:hypothetical protein
MRHLIDTDLDRANDRLSMLGVKINNKQSLTPASKPGIIAHDRFWSPSLRNIQMQIQDYKSQGYADRESYLICLAEDYGLDLEQVVKPIAELLGPSEDFDGLVSMLQDEADK